MKWIPPGERVEGPPTPGMSRSQAIVSDRMWAGYVQTEPGLVSAWHHHGDWETAVYVLTGALRMEFGPGGAEAFEAIAGDFVHVPAGAIHREGNPSSEPADVVVIRAGSGESVFNVEGPEPA